MTKTRKLRVRHAGGSTTLELTLPVKCSDVANLIASAINIPIEEQAWKGSFPPKPLTVQHNDTLPSDLDLLHVDKATLRLSGL
jgi:hypothetical protein